MNDVDSSFNKTVLNPWLQRAQNQLYSTFYREFVTGNVLEVGAGENHFDGASVTLDIRGTAEIRADLLHLPFRDRSFDLVVSRNVLGCFECIGRPELKAAMLDEMKRVAKAAYVREYKSSLCLVNFRRKSSNLLRQSAFKSSILGVILLFGSFLLHQALSEHTSLDTLTRSVGVLGLLMIAFGLFFSLLRGS